MSDRRKFLKQVTAAAVALGWGSRNLLAQVRSVYRMEGAPGAETTISGKTYLYFGGTSYYTLQNHPALLKAGAEALAKWGMHPATSRLGFGNNALYEAVEKKAAEYFGTEDAVYVASGYLGNTAGFQALSAVGKYDVVFLDDDAHYSLADFVGVLGLPVIKFAHGDPEDLRKQIKANLKAGQKPFVASDGVFPTYGLIAPIPQYLEVLAPYEGTIWLDDNHGVGVLGANGRGTYEHYNLKSDHLLFGGTFSKAFGSHGGIIPGSRVFADAIRAGHIFNGATYSISAAAAASLAGMDILMQHPEMRTQLWRNARQLKDGLRKLGFAMNDTPMPVAAWTLKSSEDMDSVHTELMKRGICIQRSHYVGAGVKGCLRAVVFSTHTPEQIDRLLTALKAFV
jgi:7-keto-8-aminopelargonate synthetase-like enzyme